jgi:hypothetical protein
MWHTFQKSLDVAFYRCGRYRNFGPSKAKLWRMVLMGIMPPSYEQHASVLAGADPTLDCASSANGFVAKRPQAMRRWWNRSHEHHR